jgi:hypothetical protein
MIQKIILATGLCVVASASARAQEPTRLPEIVIGAPAPVNAPTPGAARAPGPGPGAAGTHERCVDVRIGGEHAFGCVNERLKREVDRVNPTLNMPPIDARSPDTKTGVVNVPAVQQQYGRNFGVSAHPYRPPPLSYPSPITHR